MIGFLGFSKRPVAADKVLRKVEGNLTRYEIFIVANGYIQVLKQSTWCSGVCISWCF